MNVGVVSILIQLYILKLVLLFCLLKPLTIKFPKLRKVYESVKQKMFFNEILIIIIEGYIELLYAGVLVRYTPVNNQDNNAFAVSVGIFYFVMCLAIIPSIFFWIFAQNL